MTYEQQQARLYACENQLAAARDANCPAAVLVRICHEVRTTLEEIQGEAEARLLEQVRAGRVGATL